MERTVELIGLNNHILRIRDDIIGTIVFGDTTKESITIQMTLVHDMCTHARRCCLTMSSCHTKSFHLTGQCAQHLGTFLYFEAILAEIAQLLMLCWDSRGINHQAMFLVLTCMRNQIHVFLIMNQGTLLLQTTGQIRRSFVITCYNQATMNEITYQCTHTYTTGTNEIYSFYILCFHFLILLCSCEF